MGKAARALGHHRVVKFFQSGQKRRSQTVDFFKDEILGGGLKYFLFSSLFEEDSHFDYDTTN